MTTETRLLRYGLYAVITAAEELVYGAGDEPDIYGTVRRRGPLSVDWEITAGPTGEPLAWGRTWTRGGAWVAASAAAHRPGLTKAVTR